MMKWYQRAVKKLAQLTNVPLATEYISPTDPLIGKVDTTRSVSEVRVHVAVPTRYPILSVDREITAKLGEAIMKEATVTSREVDCDHMLYVASVWVVEGEQHGTSQRD